MTKKNKSVLLNFLYVDIKNLFIVAIGAYLGVMISLNNIRKDGEITSDLAKENKLCIIKLNENTFNLTSDVRILNFIHGLGTRSKSEEKQHIHKTTATY